MINVIFPGCVVICTKSPKLDPSIKPGNSFSVDSMSLNGAAIFLRGYNYPFYIGNFEFVYNHDDDYF